MTDWTARRVETPDGLTLTAYECGGRGPDLLLAHATGFHAHVWLPVIERLREDFRCFAFDERGHGDSDAPPDGNYDWHAFASDALVVVDAFALERPVAAGHSAGSSLLLIGEETRPATFDRLWCYEPVIFPSEEPLGEARESPLAAGARRRREVFASRDAAYDNYASKPPFSELAPEALHAYVDFGFDDLDDGTIRLKCRGENEASTYGMAAHHRAFAGLGLVDCPVTVACGELGSYAPPGMFVDQIAERLPHGTAEVMPGLSHFGPLEDPTAVANSIRRALLPD